MVDAPAPKPRGRPKKLEPCSGVTTWLPVHVHDKLVALSHQSGRSVSAIVRAVVSAAIKTKPEP
jgi:hypothetical protein